MAGGVVSGGLLGGLAGWGAGAAIATGNAAAAGTAGAAAAPAIGNVVEKASTAIQPYYPPNDGFYGAVEKITLEAGTLIQRIGSLYGTYVAPNGTPGPMLFLPYDKIGQVPTVLQVQQPIEVLAGRVAPWFGQFGGGIPYMLNSSVYNLITDGILKIMGD